MNTYNVSVNGIEVLKEVSFDSLEKELKTLRPLVWLNGGKDEDITITENNLKNF
jgi:hypothetical protein